jgi:uncharacterized protein YodC (DUF2158 family)
MDIVRPVSRSTFFQKGSAEKKMPDEFQIGYVVQLKGGGPVMTVESIDTYGGTDVRKALCVWFDGSKPTNSVFDLRTLKRVDKGH